MTNESDPVPTPQTSSPSGVRPTFWRKWGMFLVLPLSLLFVASAFALKWRNEHQRAARAGTEITGKSCCSSHGPMEERLALDVPAFSLTERSGKTVDLQDLKGRIWIGNFIYTTCPGPCPIMTSRLAALAKELPARDDLMFVSFSVDPEHDTPEVLTKFADRYHADTARWLFLTGPREEIHTLSTKGFMLALNPATQPGTDGPIIHSTRFALVDREGKIRGYYDGIDSEALARLKQDVLKLLKDAT